MLQIDERHLKKFQQIKELFYSKTKVPKPNNWRPWTNNEMWLHMVAQVIAAGGSLPAEKFEKNAGLQSKVAYERLLQISDENKLKKQLNQVLRAVGTRYASSDISKCRKTNSLAHNLKVFKNIDGDPKGLVIKLSKFEGPHEDKRRIKYVMKFLKYMKSKSARDYLMELGLVTNAIALDVRIQNILQKLGIKVPKNLENNPELYDEVENDILTKICKPLGISGVEFDRMLYQNYEEIMKMKF